MQVKKLNDRIRRGVKTVYDRFGSCVLCDRFDMVFNAYALNLCPKCVKSGRLDFNDCYIINSGVCDVCQKLFVAATDDKGKIWGGGFHVPRALVCWSCTWYKLGRKSYAPRREVRL